MFAAQPTGNLRRRGCQGALSASTVAWRPECRIIGTSCAPKNHVCDNSVNIADCSPYENMLFLLCWPRRAEIRLGAAPRGRRSGASVNFCDFYLARVSMHTTSSFSHGDRRVFRNPARAREDTSRRLSRATKKVFSKKKASGPRQHYWYQYAFTENLSFDSRGMSQKVRRG